MLWLCGIAYIILGAWMVFSTKSIKKNPEKVLATKRRKKKANKSDEEYVNSLCKSNKVCGAILCVLGVLQALIFWQPL